MVSGTGPWWSCSFEGVAWLGLLSELLESTLSKLWAMRRENAHPFRADC